MERMFIRFTSFEKAWKSQGLGEDEKYALEEMIH